MTYDEFAKTISTGGQALYDKGLTEDVILPSGLVTLKWILRVRVLFETKDLAHMVTNLASDLQVLSDHPRLQQLLLDAFNLGIQYGFGLTISDSEVTVTQEIENE